MKPSKLSVSYLADCAAINDKAGWPQPQVNLSPICLGLGAFTSAGRLAGYCGFLDRPRGPLTITAVQSRVPGAGTALLDALKERADYLLADDVLVTAEGWWQRRGFVLFEAATEDDEEGVVGAYEWFRDDDPAFVKRPYAPMWPKHRCMVQLGWDEEQHHTGGISQ